MFVMEAAAGDAVEVSYPMPEPLEEATAAWRARAHRTALNFNWDYGCAKLLEIIRRQCDLGTALLIYWRGQPDFYRRYLRRSDMPRPHDVFDMLVEIERNVQAGAYVHRNIPFNPFDDEGRKQCGNPRRDVFCELPETMYRGVGSPAEMAQREPLRSGIPDLPIGLAALAATDPVPQSDLDKVIAYLNSLNDHSGADVVQKTGDAVTRVSFFSNRKVSDDDLRHLEWFPNLIRLDLGPELTDHAMSFLRFVPQLRQLRLGAAITDAGLANLRHVPALEELMLHGCRNITDGGLANIANHVHLRKLDLGATKIGDDGLIYLRGLNNLEHLERYSYTKITNAGLAHLADLRNLKWLRLSFTKIGDRGLVHLEGLTGLKNLVLGKTKVTTKGVERLRAALPDCNVSLGEYS